MLFFFPQAPFLANGGVGLGSPLVFLLGGGGWSRRAALLAVLVALVAVALPASPRASSDASALAAARADAAAAARQALAAPAALMWRGGGGAAGLSSSSSAAAAAAASVAAPGFPLLYYDEELARMTSPAWSSVKATLPSPSSRAAPAPSSSAAALAEKAAAAAKARGRGRAHSLQQKKQTKQKHNKNSKASNAATATGGGGIEGSVWLQKAGFVSRPSGVSVSCYRGASAVPFCRTSTGAEGRFVCASSRSLDGDDNEEEDDAAAVAAALAQADLRARSSRALRKMAASGGRGPAPPLGQQQQQQTKKNQRQRLLGRALRESAQRPTLRAAAAAEERRRDLKRTAYCVFSQRGAIEPVVSAPFDLLPPLLPARAVEEAGARQGASPSTTDLPLLPPQRLFPDRSRDGVPTNGCGPRVYLAPTGRVDSTALAVAQRSAALAELAAAAASSASSSSSSSSFVPGGQTTISSFRLPRAMPVVDVGGALIPDLAFGGPCHAHDACYGTEGETRKGCDEEFEALALASCRARYLLGGQNGAVTWGSVAGAVAGASLEPSASGAAAVARAEALAGGAAEAEARLAVTGACARMARTYVAAVKQFGERSWTMSAHQRRLMSAEKAAFAR